MRIARPLWITVRASHGTYFYIDDQQCIHYKPSNIFYTSQNFDNYFAIPLTLTSLTLNLTKPDDNSFNGAHLPPFLQELVILSPKFNSELLNLPQSLTKLVICGLQWNFSLDSFLPSNLKVLALFPS